MIDIEAFENCLFNDDTQDPVMKEKLEQFRAIFKDHDVFLQRWEWGWKFYIFIHNKGQVHLNLPFDQPHGAVISDLVVERHSRGRGWGRRLVDVAEQLAILLEAETLGLWADPDDWPIAWYQRLGFLRQYTPGYHDDFLIKKVTLQK